MSRPISFAILLAAFVTFALGCAGAPKAPEGAQTGTEAVSGATDQGSGGESGGKAAPVPAFDPAKVSAETKTAAFTDIRALIDNLNKIIQRQDYDAWLANLTPAYIAYYSDPGLLAQYSEYPILKRQGVKLTTLRDYFVYLVYPSRQNDRVDDIDFVSENLVKAITVSPKGSRDILYILEKHGDTWKIGIGR